MQLAEFFDGEALTGTHAALIFGLWIGLVMVGAFFLTFVV